MPEIGTVIKQAVRPATIPAENVGLTKVARIAQTRDAPRTAYPRQFILTIEAGRGAVVAAAVASLGAAAVLELVRCP
ncbi:MAG: hypothetical protein FRX49_10437 [Trebouxia sp. A1-2]|nr:MAG: hypothetical protein FRX49_10437 [Trebouxia sp. A1-2]